MQCHYITVLSNEKWDYELKKRGLTQIFTCNITLHFFIWARKIQYRTQNKNIRQAQYRISGNVGIAFVLLITNFITVNNTAIKI